MKKEEVIEILNTQIKMYKNAIELNKGFAACSSGANDCWDKITAECESAIDVLEYVRDKKIEPFDDRPDDQHAELINTYVKERIENDIGLGIGVKQRIREFFDEAAGAFKKPELKEAETHDYVLLEHTIEKKFDPSKQDYAWVETYCSTVSILPNVSAAKAMDIYSEYTRAYSKSGKQYSLERLDQ